MKLRRDFLLALVILFAIPVFGYLVLKWAEDDRLKISASLQPKDSIELDFRINYLSEEGEPKARLLQKMPYVLMVVSTEEGMLDQHQVGEILYIINDREDLAFLMHHPTLRLYDEKRIRSYNYFDDGGGLNDYGDILLVDTYNRILQIYDQDDPELYKKLLEDISYALPMVDFRIEKRSGNEN